jgi:ATP-dependent DNA helicase RecQ
VRPCDFCAPQDATAQTFRTPTTEEDRQLRAILRALDGTSRATGKLHTELSTGALRNTPGADRKIFDSLLDALTRSGLIALNTDQWTNPEGNLITFKKASLTHEGRTLTGPLPPDLLIKDPQPSSGSSRSKTSRSTAGARPSRTSLKADREQTTAAYTQDQKSLEATLRSWRKAEAAKTGKPAFMVFGDSVLHNLVLAAPRTISDLQAVPGIGPDKADRYGADIIAVCRSEVPPSTPLPRKEASSRPRQSEVERPPQSARTTPNANSANEVAVASRYPRASALGLSAHENNETLALGVSSHSPQTFARARLNPEPAETLTPDQQALDQRLRDWRKAESEKLNLPLFFVLASNTLRSIVLARPQTLSQLKTIHGLGQEKIEKFGPSIIEVCTT